MVEYESKSPNRIISLQQKNVSNVKYMLYFIETEQFFHFNTTNWIFDFLWKFYFSGFVIISSINYIKD